MRVGTREIQYPIDRPDKVPVNITTEISRSHIMGFEKTSIVSVLFIELLIRDIPESITNDAGIRLRIVIRFDSTNICRRMIFGEAPRTFLVPSSRNRPDAAPLVRNI